jgi:hypothetical protein
MGWKMQQSNSILGKNKHFPILHSVQTGTETDRGSYPISTASCRLPWVKRPELTTHFPLVLGLSITVAHSQMEVRMYLTKHMLMLEGYRPARNLANIQSSLISPFKNTLKICLCHKSTGDYLLINFYFSMIVNTPLSMARF